MHFTLSHCLFIVYEPNKTLNIGKVYSNVRMYLGMSWRPHCKLQVAYNVSRLLLMEQVSN